MKEIIRIREKRVWERLPSQASLVMEFSASSLTLALADAPAGKLMALESYDMDGGSSGFPDDIPQAIESITRDIPVLQTLEGKKTFLLDIYRHILVPQAVYDPFQKEKYVRAHLPMKKFGEWVLADPLPELDAHNLFVVPLGLDQRMGNLIQGAVMRHSCSPFFSALLNNPAHSAGSHLVLRLEKDHVHCVLLMEGRLSRTNTYRVDHPSDLAYFLLLFLSQAGVQGTSVSPWVCGRMSAEEERVSTLREILGRNPKPCLPEGLKASAAFEPELLAAHYTALTALL